MNSFKMHQKYRELHLLYFIENVTSQPATRMELSHKSLQTLKTPLVSML